MQARAVAIVIYACFSASVWAADSWPRITLASPRDVEIKGELGESLQRGLNRLAQPPYTTEWLLSDVSFQVNRIFTNYSGDVSGRFLELAALTTPLGRFEPPTLQAVVARLPGYQKTDGHFGLDMDLSKPMQKLSPPIPMLWGNARLLAGLVTAAEELRDTNLLAAARRLGDFYVATADIFCSPAREQELRATGTGGDGYTCCYFPAIESLALLYKATKDERYLGQARRMAEWFKKFDALPTDHSHGNLCAWRGILELYETTGERSYLDRALAKWDTAVQDGYVWPLGGIGEHWYRFHSGDEGCSESDWLRFNLQLWRFTGETRFLDMAERLLRNQYAGNQCANGGYGWRPFDGYPEGPVGTTGNLDEWYFCCSFHGPLGLHFLKAYLAAASGDRIFVNFPVDFSSTVSNRNEQIQVSVRTVRAGREDERRLQIDVRPLTRARSVRTTLWIRRPDWAKSARVALASGKQLLFSEENGYLKVSRPFGANDHLQVIFQTALRLERRRFGAATVPRDKVSRWRDVAFLQGPDVLFAVPAFGPGRITLLAQADDQGQLRLWQGTDGRLITVGVPGLASGLRDISEALERAPLITLCSESDLHTHRRAAFMHDVIVVPSKLLSNGVLAGFSKRVASVPESSAGCGFGTQLEQKPDAWTASAGWHFSPNGLRITGGDVGLLDFNPGANYRFEFDLELPNEGQGIAGWVVRAQGPGDCLLFQIQSADSTYSAPEFKTRPNTLRPHIRRYGEWTIADPVPLSKPLHRGENHHFAVDCKGPVITVYLDGAKVYTGDDGGFSSGTVGFRATGPSEQGLFRNISLSR